jgi:TolB-like protein/Tfp pilus assembly protein PilF
MDGSRMPVASGCAFAPPDLIKIRAQLEKLLRAPGFASSARRSQLLRYLIEQSLAGKGEQISEYGIGIDIFERPDSFDPRLESIVRTETSRIRQKLKDYYAGEGLADDIVIDIPPRSYAPTITFREPAASSKEPVPEVPPTPGFPWKKIIVPSLAALIVLAFLAGRAGFRFNSPPNPPSGSIVVLPFQNLSPDGNLEYIADGVTEELTNQLAQWQTLRVVARTSAAQFKGKGVDIREIGRRLNASAALEGSVGVQQDRVRITAQLNRTSDGYHLWSHSYEGPYSDIMAIQAEVAGAVESAVYKLGKTPPPPAQHVSTSNPEAHDLYLQANYQFAKRTPESQTASLALFEKAVAKDPSYVAAYIGIARSEIARIHYTTEVPKEGLERVRAALEKAIAIDPDSAEAHGMLGYIAYNYDWDWPRAEHEYRLALEHGAESTTQSFYAAGLASRGRFGEAREHFRIAQDLDPLGTGPRFNQMLAFYQERKYKEAITALHGLLDMNPNLLDAHLFLGLIGAIQHDCNTATTEFEWSAQRYQMPVTKFGLAVSSACRGETAQARRYLAEMEAGGTGFASPYQLALGFAFLHDKDEAFNYLEKSANAREGQILYLKYEPVFDEIRTDPRYIALERRVGLE